MEGWNILSSDVNSDLDLIRRAKEYNISHLQLSHDVIHFLRELRDPAKQKQCNLLIDSAHKAGINEVVIWDHSLYDMEYYPDRFKINGNKHINLDDPEFWSWLKIDYRHLLDLSPNLNGIVLTFIETGAFIEDQYSEKMTRKEEKLAALIDTLAGVIINERGLKFYIRTFIYTQAELEPILKCIKMIKNKDVIVMVKETPQDFFLTFRNQNYLRQIHRKVLIEFDCGNEYNGQNVIANTFVGEKAARWRYYMKQENVIGYVARTSRMGTTSIIDEPSEILLYTLHRLTEEPGISDDQIYDEFIRSRYNEQALPYIKSAFKKSFDIITSTLYTLGLNTAKHSWLDFDYISNYTRFVPGRWLKREKFFVGHNVNRKFHYYTDIVEHLSPAKYKSPESRLFEEDPFLIRKKWVSNRELMDSTYLSYVITEKDYGVELAEEALHNIEQTRDMIDPASYRKLYGTYYRTWLTAKLYRASAKMYYGNRIASRGESFRTDYLAAVIHEGIDEMLATVPLIDQYDETYPIGGWDWKQDAVMATAYYEEILKTDWPVGGKVTENR